MSDSKQPALTTHLVVDDGAGAIDFYARVFGARERYRLRQPDGRVGHAELELGGTIVALADEFPEMDILGPKRRGGTSASLALDVADVDAVAARAVAAGAVLERPIADEFYGKRVAWLRDPYGHRWSLQAHIEDVTPEEMQRRLDAMFASP